METTRPLIQARKLVVATTRAVLNESIDSAMIETIDTDAVDLFLALRQLSTARGILFDDYARIAERFGRLNFLPGDFARVPRYKPTR